MLINKAITKKVTLNSIVFNVIRDGLNIKDNKETTTKIRITLPSLVSNPLNIPLKEAIKRN